VHRTCSKSTRLPHSTRRPAVPLTPRRCRCSPGSPTLTPLRQRSTHWIPPRKSCCDWQSFGSHIGPSAGWCSEIGCRRERCSMRSGIPRSWSMTKRTRTGTSSSLRAKGTACPRRSPHRSDLGPELPSDTDSSSMPAMILRCSIAELPRQTHRMHSLRSHRPVNSSHRNRMLELQLPGLLWKSGGLTLCLSMLQTTSMPALLATSRHRLPSPKHFPPPPR